MKVMKSNNVKLIDSPDQISDFILKFRGGSEEFSEQKLEEIVRSIPSDDKLIKSILSKIPDSNHSIISINKILKKIVKVIDPVVTNLRLWQVLGYQKSITVNVNAPQQTQSSILVNALFNNRVVKAFKPLIEQTTYPFFLKYVMYSVTFS
jgi:hypothetical protein